MADLAAHGSTINHYLACTDIALPLVRQVSPFPIIPRRMLIGDSRLK